MQRICHECAIHNGGEWIETTIATAEFGKCDCCGKITTIVSKAYYKNLPSNNNIKSHLEKKQQDKRVKKVTKSNNSILD